MKALGVLTAAVLLGGSGSFAADLSFEDRVRAQEAIERVYYSHQIGTILPFERAITRETLEKKVRTYLRQSAALDMLWQTPVTAEALETEMERIVHNTLFPERLREIYSALGYDPILVQESFVRPVLVDRLARDFFAFDEGTHAEARDEARRLREDLLRGAIDVREEHPARRTSRIVIAAEDEDAVELPRYARARAAPGELSSIAMNRREYGRWRNTLPSKIGAIGPIEEDEDSFAIRVVLEEDVDEAVTATWTVPKTSWDVWWRQSEGALDEDLTILASDRVTLTAPLGREHDCRREALSGSVGNLDPCVDELWDNGSSNNPPRRRLWHTAVWTGNLMLIWGGEDHVFDYVYLESGGRYDPITDTWSATSLMGAPWRREGHTAVWTGSEMVVWGGFSETGSGVFHRNDGGRYDPISDTWTSTSTTGAPSERSFHTAIWTGSQMIVWGGMVWSSTAGFNTGGRYDPSTDSWTPTWTDNAPAGRYSHTVVWTGTVMIVWGGQYDFDFNKFYLNSGGRYDPASGTWSATTASILQPRYAHSAVWTGSHMIVWGGKTSAGSTNTGGKYDPQNGAWTPASSSNSPDPRLHHSAVWTGREMIVWGGGTDVPGLGAELNSGGRYDPSLDTWWATPMEGYTPTHRYGQAAVWTGAHMVIWGGSRANQPPYDNGGRYMPPDADGDGLTRCGGDCDDAAASVYPGAPEVCDGVNNDCAHPSWPDLAGIETDDDGDAVSECNGDCDDADSALWGIPGPVADLAFLDDVTLSWTAPPQAGSTGGLLYDTLRVVDAIDFTTSMTCIAYDAAAPGATDSAVPPLGSVAYYLARAQNACGLGSLGAASDGAHREGSDCQPTARQDPHLDL